MCNFKKPSVAIIPVTYRCNAKCAMCSIWKNHEGQEMPLEELLGVFEDPTLTEQIRSINLTGGEPTLRKDLVQIAEGLLKQCPNLASLTLNTNGLNPERLVQVVTDLLALQKKVRPFELYCYLSVDGIAETHDKSRGVPGSFEKVMKSLDYLKELQEICNFSYSVNFTIHSGNYLEMENVYEMITAKELQIDFTYSMESGFYFKNSDLDEIQQQDEQMREHVVQVLQKILPEGKLTYAGSNYRNLIKMLKGSPRKIGCIFKDQGFFLDPSGTVYRCWAYDQPLGNLRERSFSEIWEGAQAQETLDGIQDICKTCYNNCYILYKRIDSVQKLFKNK